METRVVAGVELHEVARSILLKAIATRDPQRFMATIVIGGDRIACCDEGVVFDDDPYRGVATIAPDGEFGGNGLPSILGVFVRATDRQRGYGTALFTAAVRRCIEQGFGRVHVDVLSEGMRHIVEKLPRDLRAVLEVEWNIMMLA